MFKSAGFPNTVEQFHLAVRRPRWGKSFACSLLNRSPSAMQEIDAQRAPYVRHFVRLLLVRS